MDNIDLNEKELKYISDTDFLKTKFTIMNKIVQMYAITERQLKKVVENNSHHVDAIWIAKSGKISKGENYRHLPYVVLDFPRYFTKDEVFAFRSMFWWGNHFSCTLHIQGDWFNSIKKRFINSLVRSDADVFICVNESPWEYHFGPDNYRSIKELSQKELELLIDEKPFIKVSQKMGIEDWRIVPEFCMESYQNLIELVLQDEG